MAAFVFALAWLDGMLSAHHVAALSEAGVFLLGALNAAIPGATIWGALLGVRALC